MRLLMILFPAFACLLGGCCGACGEFWTEVKQGMYYEAKPFGRIQKVVAQSFPKKFDSTGRVILRMGSSQDAFTLRIRVDATKGEMRLAGISDLGNVIFSALSSKYGMKVVKNNSGWPDEVIEDALVTSCRQLTMFSLSEDCIVQKTPRGRWLYRSVNNRDEIEEVELNESGDRILMVRLRRFSLFGEKEYLRRVHIPEYAQFDGTGAMYPKRLEILDENHGYRAEIHIQKLKPIQ